MPRTYAVLVDIDHRHDLTPVELRKLATDALAAARWLDGNTWCEGVDDA